MTTAVETVARHHIIYPESDGKPMGETETHRQELSDAIEALKDYFRNQADVYISGNMFIYYVEGKPKKVVCPDVFVVRGLDKRRRRSYFLWKEERTPCFVIELTSKATRRDDEEDKKNTYAELGVHEYFLCDPLAEYMQPPLQGYHLVEGSYVPIAPDADGWLPSAELGLRLRLEPDGLRFADAATGERLLKPHEVAEARRAEAEARRAEAEARRAAERQARAEARRAESAEAELARLRDELARLRGEQN
ncbi:MAG: Uma2 family endonuclease [Chloroflexaceae bacterium]|jgi:Uma2 family endonuclease|nr:Uma2 family endonuclease [Chloroflexaceae bacterium]